MIAPGVLTKGDTPSRVDGVDRWIDFLAARGLHVESIPAKDIHKTKIEVSAPAHDAPWVHFHFSKRLPPPWVLSEVCCHGCGASLLVTFKHPGYDGPYPVLMFVREQFMRGHIACGPKWHKAHKFYTKGLEKICNAIRTRAWALRIENVTGRA